MVKGGSVANENHGRCSTIRYSITMLTINLRSGKVLDAEKVVPKQHVVKLYDHNSDLITAIGIPLIESIESA